MSTAMPSAPKPSLLLALAERIPASEPSLVEGWVYRRDLGVWVDADRPFALMVMSGGPKPGPRPPGPSTPVKPKPRPASKKYDRETGEDMKGA
jgi:hypothetical protein